VSTIIIAKNPEKNTTKRKKTETASSYHNNKLLCKINTLFLNPHSFFKKIFNIETN
jgi:hypothetical protein